MSADRKVECNLAVFAWDGREEALLDICAELEGERRGLRTRNGDHESTEQGEEGFHFEPCRAVSCRQRRCMAPDTIQFIERAGNLGWSLRS